MLFFCDKSCLCSVRNAQSRYFSNTLVDRLNKDKSKVQRWSRGHKALGQGHKKNPRPRTALLRTDPLEAKDRNGRGQGSRRPAQSSPKKKVFRKFSDDLQKKRSSKFFFRQSPRKGGKQKKVFANFPRGFWRFPTKY